MSIEASLSERLGFPLQTIGGALDEFVFAARIDNLMNCYTALQVCMRQEGGREGERKLCCLLLLQGLINSLDTLDGDTNVRMVTMFDNEEVKQPCSFCWLCCENFPQTLF